MLAFSDSAVTGLVCILIIIWLLTVGLYYIIAAVIDITKSWSLFRMFSGFMKCGIFYRVGHSQPFFVIVLFIV
jgi:hypothetical protein